MLFRTNSNYIAVKSGSVLVGGWTNPPEKYESKLGIFPKIGTKMKNIQNHHLVYHMIFTDQVPPNQKKYLKTVDSAWLLPASSLSSCTAQAFGGPVFLSFWRLLVEHPKIDLSGQVYRDTKRGGS